MSGDPQPNWWVRAQALFDKLTGTLDTLSEAVTGLVNLLPNPIHSPVTKTLVGSKTGASTTYAFIDLGYPPAGKVWDVRHVSVWTTGTDSFTAPASVIAELAVIAGAVPPDGSGAPPLERVVNVATSANLPNSSSIARLTVTLVNRSHLVVLLKSIGTNVVQAAAQVAEWDEADKASWLGA